MNKSGVYVFWMLFFLNLNLAAARVKQDEFLLLCDNKVNPVGVAVDELTFSCLRNRLNSSGANQSYRIVVSSSYEKLIGGEYDCWDSGILAGSDGYRISYGGKKLPGSSSYYWRVQYGNAAKRAWTPVASFVTAPLQSDWAGARWICYANMPEARRLVPGIHVHENPEKITVSDEVTIPLFRKAFNVKKPIRQASLFISGLGHYVAYINGERVDDRVLSPGWTQYDKQVLFNSYDVTRQLKKGENAIGAIVGNGFHYIATGRYHKLMIAYGYPKLICMLKITHDDNTTQLIVSDSSWKTNPSAITYSSIYGGETFDARLEQEGWNQRGFDDSEWQEAQLAGAPAGKLEPETGYPVTIRQRFAPQRQYRLSDDSFTIDFGQNASGSIAVKLKGKRGDTVRFWPAELITPDKRANQKASGSPYYFEYVLKGGEEEYWHPMFTYYGFRYLTVEGAGDGMSLQGESSPGTLLSCELQHLRNSAPATGSFTCSSDLLNRIYSLINWAIRSNMQSVLTDCPHREKLGWLEQSYLMGNSIRYNYDVYHLYRKKIRDMIHAQRDNGLIPDIAPEYVVFSDGFVDSPEWGSAGVLLPWMVYKWYGDRRLLEEAYPMMTGYVNYLSSKATGNLLSHGLGDWFDYGPQAPGVAQLTPVALTASAIYFKDVSVLSDIARLLGNERDALFYKVKADSIRKAFNDRFYDPVRKVYSTGSQTALAMPLCLNIPEPDERPAIYESLKRRLENDGYALTAGDIGFHFLVEALSEPRYSGLLYKMINREDVPGYGFQLAKGATALTESWPALEEVSNNHLMLGHLMEWFYTGVLGIIDAPDAVASDKIVIRPTPVGDLNSAEGHFNSPRGTIRVAWKLIDNEFEMTCTVPDHTSATIVVPAGFKSCTLQRNAESAMPFETAQLVTSGVYTVRAKR